MNFDMDIADFCHSKVEVLDVYDVGLSEKNKKHKIVHDYLDRNRDEKFVWVVSVDGQGRKRGTGELYGSQAPSTPGSRKVDTYLAAAGYFHEDCPDKVWRLSSPDGIYAQCSYQTGQKEGLYCARYNNGVIGERGSYKQNRKEAEWRYHRPDGSLETSVTYSIGQAIALNAWHQNGVQQQQMLFNEDSVCCLSKEWDDQGNMVLLTMADGTGGNVVLLEAGCDGRILNCENWKFRRHAIELQNLCAKFSGNAQYMSSINRDVMQEFISLHPELLQGVVMNEDVFRTAPMHLKNGS